MRPLALLLLLFSIPFVSFQFEEEKNRGSFIATIDNKPFKVREDQLYRGLVMAKAGSMDGKSPARNVVSTTFNGSNYNLKDGRSFSENVWIEIDYTHPFEQGSTHLFSVSSQFDGTNYFMLNEQNTINVTEIAWGTDKKYFLLSAEIKSKMRSMGYPADGKRDVILQGKMTNIRITVPSWLAKS